MKKKSDFFEKWGYELQKYCKKHSLDYKLLKRLGASYNFEEGYISFDKPWDEESEKFAKLELEGKLPKQYMKKVLHCEFTENEITFTQTEYTEKYLALQ